MRLLLDCDGVLADLDSYFLAWLRREEGLRFSLEDLTDFDYCKALGVSKATESRFWAEVEHAQHCSRLAAYDGARAFVQTLQRSHDVRALTATSGAAWTGQRAEWLERVVGIQAQHQIICGKTEKPFVGGDALIEDAPHNVTAWLAAQPGHCVLMTRACNAKMVLPDRCFRADTYEAALAVIGGL